MLVFYSTCRFLVKSTNLAFPVFEFTIFRYQSLGIIVICKKSTYPLIKFERELEVLFQRHTFLKRNGLVLRDFNLCLQTIYCSLRKIFDFLADAKGFSSLLNFDSPTTNFDTPIDWVFSNSFDNRATVRVTAHVVADLQQPPKPRRQLNGH